MPKPESKTLLTVLRESAELARGAKLENHEKKFDQFYNRFQTEKPTLKALRADVEPTRMDFCIKIEETIFDSRRKPLPGMESLVEEYYRICRKFVDLIYPSDPQPNTLDITRFNNSELVKHKNAPYFGGVSGVRFIVEQTIELIRRYTQAIGRGDFETAYSMTASGLRAWMSQKRFITEHEKAAKMYGGSALEFRIERFQLIYADNQARKKSKAGEGWPKTTPKEQRYSCLTGFWIRNASAQTGCWGGFCISEEQGEYRVASFTFYTQ